MLTQTEADTLIAMRKTFLHPRTISLPRGADETHDLIGEDKRELFLLDLWRGTIRLSKFRYQTRGRKVIVLVRLDIDGAPTQTPTGPKSGDHISTYIVKRTKTDGLLHWTRKSSQTQPIWGDLSRISVIIVTSK